MLKLGDQGIKALYVGGYKIAKAYVGEELVFKEPAKPSHNLPADYTELEYIQIGPSVTTAIQYSWGSLYSDSELYVDFDVIAFPATSSTMYDSEAQLLFASVVENQVLKNRMVCFPSISSNRPGVQYGSFASGTVTNSALKPITSNTSVPQSVKLTVDYPNKLLKNNGIAVGTLDSNNLYVGAFYLGTKVTPSGNMGWKTACVRIKELKISSAKKTSATYSKHWIPAKNASGYVGFYDIVNNSWKRINVATAGPAI